MSTRSESPGAAATGRLLVNADDLGIAPGTNRAIAAAFDQGGLTGASLMVNMPATEAAVRLIAERPRMAAGLHVCLTSGRSVLPAARIPLLTDTAGRFRHSFLGLWRLLRSREADAARGQIEAEIRGQWARARALGVRPGHIDSHQHVHMLPGIFPIVATLAAEVRVPLRVSREPLRAASLWHGPRAAAGGPAGCAKAALLGCLARRASTAVVRRSDWCLGIVHSGRMTRDTLAGLLRSLPAGSVEVITHPSLPGPRMHDDALSDADRHFLESPMRRLEYDAVVDPFLVGWIAGTARRLHRVAAHDAAGG